MSITRTTGRRHTAASLAVTLAVVAGATIGATPVVASAIPTRPVVVIDGGAVRGVAVPGGGAPHRRPPLEGAASSRRLGRCA
jgi:hypothetical protein